MLTHGGLDSGVKRRGANDLPQPHVTVLHPTVTSPFTPQRAKYDLNVLWIGDSSRFLTTLHTCIHATWWSERICVFCGGIEFPYGAETRSLCLFSPLGSAIHGLWCWYSTSSPKVQKSPSHMIFVIVVLIFVVIIFHNSDIREICLSNVLPKL